MSIGDARVTCHHDRAVPRVLLLLPTSTYRAPDFVVPRPGSGWRWSSGPRRAGRWRPTGDRAVVVPLDEPEPGADLIVALDGRRRSTRCVAVDDRGVMVAAPPASGWGSRTTHPSAVAATRDKAAMRQALAAAEVPQPAFAWSTASLADVSPRPHARVPRGC